MTEHAFLWLALACGHYVKATNQTVQVLLEKAREMVCEECQKRGESTTKG